MGCTVTKPKKESTRKDTSTNAEDELAKDGKLKNYEFQKLLGNGKYGRVFLAHSQVENRLVAVKALPKSAAKAPSSEMMREVDMLTRVDHPNIVKYYKHLQSTDYFYIVMEYCEGGDLFERIIKNDKYSEAQAAEAMGEILRAINHCHTLGLLHRDLKPENIMYTSEGHIKIIDFGLSMLDKGFSSESLAGTAYYIAPEVIEDEIFTKACDIWSLGVILHVMLSGLLPIGGKTNEEIFNNIRHFSGPSFSHKDWEGVSAEAKDLVRQMLNTNYENRISAGEALKHRWFSTQNEKHSEPLPNILPALQKYSGFNKLKKKALNLLVNNTNESTLRKFQTQFIELDKDGTGLITCDALQACLKSEGYDMSADELEKLTRQVNYEGEPFINYTEFLAAVASTQKFLTNERLWTLFNQVDTDHNGWITEADLRFCLARRQRLMSLEVQRIMKDVDSNNDGKITFEDFKQFMMVGF